MSAFDQVAFDMGYGRRGISYATDNPFCLRREPIKHQSWDAGWLAADAEANASAARAVAKILGR